MSNQNNNRNYNDIGTRIQESVNEALSTGEFSKLNSEIQASVLSVLNEVGDQLNGAVSAAKNSAMQGNRGYYGSTQSFDRGFRQNLGSYNDRDVARHQQSREALVKKPQAQSPVSRVKFHDVGAVSGYFGVFGGAWLALVGAIGMASESLLFGIVVGLGFLAIAKGSNNIKWHNLAKRYKKLVSEKMYIGVDAIADATGTSQKKVVKNVKKMLAKGFFPEGYIDDTNTTFMASKEIYDQYIETKKNAVDRMIAKNQEEENAAQANVESKMNSMISAGMRYTDRLHELNEQIPGEVITIKLSKMENILNEIFNRVKEHPELIDNCRKLMDYYLPMIIKLVEAYAEYDKVSQPGEDIISAKKDIENTLDITNQSFTELLNKLYMDSVWDVKSDAKVLKTMLRQEGLAEDNLGKKNEAINTNFGVEYVTAGNEYDSMNSAEDDEIETVTAEQLRPVSQVLER